MPGGGQDEAINMYEQGGRPRILSDRGTHRLVEIWSATEYEIERQLTLLLPK